MTSLPSIICFKHCSSESIICKQVPTVCPLCQKSTTTFILEPFQIPFPFTKATENPTSIVIRPSSGDFLNNFNTNSDLHIGIVNSTCHIFEFDKRGLTKNDFTKWTNCFALKLVPSSWELHWDETLETTCQSLKWQSHNYDDKLMNCFNFVIEFLRLLKYESVQFMTKEDMCEAFILPKLQEALRYISLYRKLINVNCFLQN